MVNFIASAVQRMPRGRHPETPLVSVMLQFEAASNDEALKVARLMLSHQGAGRALADMEVITLTVHREVFAERNYGKAPQKEPEETWHDIEGVEGYEYSDYLPFNPPEPGMIKVRSKRNPDSGIGYAYKQLLQLLVFERLSKPR